MDQNLAVIFLRLVETAAENIQGKKQFTKFRMLQIEEACLLYLYVCNADVSNRSNISL